MALPMNASSATAGFFQALPKLEPQYTYTSDASTSKLPQGDPILPRILDLYLPPTATNVHEHIHHLSRVALHPTTLAHSVDAETNPPSHHPLTTFGAANKRDPLRTPAGWKALKQIGYREGVIAVAYETENQSLNRRIYEFSLGHVWNVTGTMTGCPMSMTDGAAVLLSRHLNDPDGDQPGRSAVLRDAFQRLTGRDPEFAWTSGQWMTERSGGSDVSGTETVATRLTEEDIQKENDMGGGLDAVGHPLGPWRIDGFKWFSSATDSEMAVLLAKTEKGGLSAFYVPMRKRVGEGEETELNGICIQRLKNKLGTKAVPTAELTLNATRGYLIGTESQGIKAISAILNITRLHTAAGSVSNWSRGLALSRAYTRVRRVRGSLLQDNIAHMRWLAQETIKYHAGAHFSFFCVALQGVLEQDWDTIVRHTKAQNLVPRNKDEVSTLLRLLTPVLKARVSVASVHGLRECMESLGGVGYCENNEDGGVMNLARVYRDNLVNPIWEGTVSVMAEDVVRVLLDKRLGDGNVLENVFETWVENVLQVIPEYFERERAACTEQLKKLKAVVDDKNREALIYRGREILELFETIVCGCLLMYDAFVENSEVARTIACRWVRSRIASEDSEEDSWRNEAEMDKMILFGRQNQGAQQAKL